MHPHETSSEMSGAVPIPPAGDAPKNTAHQSSVGSPPKLAGPFSALASLDEVSAEEFSTAFIRALALSSSEEGDASSEAIKLLSHYGFNEDTRPAWNLLAKTGGFDEGFTGEALSQLLEIPEIASEDRNKLLENFKEKMPPDAFFERVLSAGGGEASKVSISTLLLAIDEKEISPDLKLQAFEALCSKSELDPLLVLHSLVRTTRGLREKYGREFLYPEPGIYGRLVAAVAQQPWTPELNSSWRFLFGAEDGSGNHLVIHNRAAADGLKKFFDIPGVSGLEAVGVYRLLMSFNWNKGPIEQAAREVSSRRPLEGEVPVAFAKYFGEYEFETALASIEEEGDSPEKRLIEFALRTFGSGFSYCEILRFCVGSRTL
ncbi:MAG: hypothetical protein KDD70_12820 [Bdellovibrionales bacterium]|nr:hypothetical protein [Bdellovibrionales bacterium]